VCYDCVHHCVLVVLRVTAPVRCPPAPSAVPLAAAGLHHADHQSCAAGAAVPSARPAAARGRSRRLSTFSRRSRGSGGRGRRSGGRRAGRRVLGAWERRQWRRPIEPGTLGAGWVSGFLWGPVLGAYAHVAGLRRGRLPSDAKPSAHSCLLPAWVTCPLALTQTQACVSGPRRTRRSARARVAT
jgi:hypothetical protein